MMIWLWVFLMGFAQAGFLQMEGTADLKIEERRGQLFLVGSYAIENQGDEASLKVFPEIHLDQFVWSGEPRRLEAGGRSEWALNEKLRGLCEAGGSGCVMPLPSRGQFLLKILKHYSDLNSYPFAVPDVVSVSTAEVAPQLKVQMDPAELDEGTYRVFYRVRNQSEDLQKVLLDPWVPQELRLLTTALPVEIPPQGEIQGSFQVENLKGLPGSHYFLYLTVIGEREGLRFGTSATSDLAIEKPKAVLRWSGDQIFGFALGLGLVLGLAGMWWFWERPLRRMG